MGKSPGKWIKSVLFRKKSSNSSLPKKRDIVKSSYEKASSAPLQTPVNNVVVQPCFISEPVLVTGAAGYEKKELESGRTEITAVSIAEPTLSSTSENGDARATLNHDVTYESEKYKLEQAATKVQATFRGYRARRAFRTLKGIIRLQAVIRGHLVRRQAVATLNCFLGIVKFQALVRGRMVRRSDLGTQIYAKQTLSKQDGGFLDSVTVYSCRQRDKLKKNAFTYQLLSSSSSAMPLCLPYDPEEPNSAWNWLLRWTMSHFSGTLLENETIILSKNKIEERRVSKLSRPRKKPVNVGETSVRSTSESGKVKHNSRPNETDRKSNSPVPEMAETEPKNSPNKATQVLQGIAPDSVGQEKCMVLPMGEDRVNNFGDHLISSSLPNETQESEKDLLGQENHKISKRRASLPAYHDDQETSQQGTKVPSYMAATKSAKAKVRGQASPRFGQEEVEKNGPVRRYSLPSSVNAKPTSSPRVQRLVQSNGKSGIRMDRSLSTSRDGNEKMVQPGWKR